MSGPDYGDGPAYRDAEQRSEEFDHFDETHYSEEELEAMYDEDAG